MYKLMHGDCLELMKNIPNGSIDMVLTDPPYGISYQSGRRKERYKNIINDNCLFWLDYFVKILYDKVKVNSGHYIFCSHHNIDIFKQSFEKFFIVKNILVWVKNNHGSGDLKGDYAPKHEFIIFVTKGRHILNNSRDSNVLNFNKVKSDLHPTVKPTDLCEFLIKKSSKDNDVIFDPFMGSGSTGIACLNTNRKFIGIEKDDHYFNVAKNRIEQHKLGLQMGIK